MRCPNETDLSVNHRNTSARLSVNGDFRERLGSYELFYIRDKERHEIDFLVVKNGKPWLMVDVSNSESKRISQSLLRFNEQLNVPHTFEVVPNMPYVDKDCFSKTEPISVPLVTFLSQLV